VASVPALPVNTVVDVANLQSMSGYSMICFEFESPITSLYVTLEQVVGDTVSPATYQLYQTLVPGPIDEGASVLQSGTLSGSVTKYTSFTYPVGLFQLFLSMEANSGTPLFNVSVLGTP
jgi:hypothetical protein